MFMMIMMLMVRRHAFLTVFTCITVTSSVVTESIVVRAEFVITAQMANACLIW